MNFVVASLHEHINAVLAENQRFAKTTMLPRWNQGFDTQIMLDTSGLELVTCEIDGKTFEQWEDPETFESYRQIRIPSLVYSDSPYFSDFTISDDHRRRWDLIGMSGWNWKEKRSHWIGIDIDSDDGHAKGHTQGSVDYVAGRVDSLDYTLVRRSKSGKGVHVLVPFEEPVRTSSYQSHRRLAKHVVGILGSDLSLDISPYVDRAGGLLWEWTRTPAASGYTLFSNF